MGCALIYLTWELLRQDWVTANIPGMFRFLFVIICGSVIVGAVGPKVILKLHGSSTQRQGEAPPQRTTAAPTVNAEHHTADLITSGSQSPPHIAPAKRPHIRIVGLNRPTFSESDRLRVEVVLENDGEEDAEVLTTAGVIVHEVYADVAARRQFENSLFDKTRSLPQNFDNPATHTFPAGAKRTLPIERPWGEQWNKSEPGSPLGIYVKGTVLYRSRTDHRYVRTGEFCKYILDSGTLVECADHNIDP